MPDMHGSLPWISLLLLGAFHGLNPAMGWLFAVSLGFQERRLRAVVKALGPITLGHALSITLFAVPVGLLGLVIPQDLLLTLCGSVLLGFAGYKIVTRFRHPRWVGMRIGARELVLWSFLMATAHGAGLMLTPVLARMQRDETHVVAAQTDESVALAGAGHAGHAEHLIATSPAGHMGHQMPGGEALGSTVAAVALHSVAMLAVAALIAVVVYRKLGVEILRRAWINLDLVWFSALVAAGGITLGLGLWPLLMG